MNTLERKKTAAHRRKPRRKKNHISNDFSIVYSFFFCDVRHGFSFRLFFSLFLLNAKHNSLTVCYFFVCRTLCRRHRCRFKYVICFLFKSLCSLLLNILLLFLFITAYMKDTRNDRLLLLMIQTYIY